MNCWNITLIGLVFALKCMGNPVVFLNWDKAHEGFANKGGVQILPGPTPLEYPLFSKKNKAAYFDGGGRLEYNDPGEGSPLDFSNGDSITLEAWVSPQSMPDGNNIYIIGKGCTGNPGQKAKNQNFALRLRGQGGMGCASFLFYSAPAKDHAGDWHRWTTNTGIIPQDGWGHVAVTYTFGKPETIRGYINGKPAKGKWDMGGATELPPVVDNDQLWVGAALKGSRNSSFHGGMDNVAVHREALSAEIFAKRYQRKREEKKVVKFERPDWPTNSVAFEIIEGFNPVIGWPAADLPVVEAYERDFLSMFRVPHKYGETGVRVDRSKAFLLRAMTTLSFPEGEHEWIVRNRWATKLWLDGELVQNFPQKTRYGGAHGSVPKIPEDWPDYLRLPSPGVAEHRFGVTSDGKPVQLRIEMVVGDLKGKKRYRHDLGESLLAVSISGQPFEVVGPGGSFPLNDYAWMDWRRREEQALQDLDTQHRRRASKESSKAWIRKHLEAREIASDWVVADPPGIPNFLPSNNAIDQFIGQGILDAVGMATGNDGKGIQFFHQSIKPLLEDKCVKCHHGKKAKSGLYLDSLAGMLKGGDSGEPALVPGDVEKSLLFTLAYSRDEDDRMPPKGDPVNAGELRALRQWIELGAPWPGESNQQAVANKPAASTRQDVEKAGLMPSNLTNDLGFVRRVSLDVTGVFPAEAEVAAFLSDDSDEKRAKLIDRFLDKEGWAHNWVGYWQDVLAENPNILKPRLNNTGPFREWIFESLLDNKPMDRFASELVMMQGSKLGGGPAGFGLATQNDVPMAAKAHVLGTAFLGTNMQCARCHDAPYHPIKQADLFGMAAMLNRNALKVPPSSSASLPDLGGRKPLIEVTLKPNAVVQPQWGFPSLFDPALSKVKDSREELATMISTAHNQRFAEVMVNRVWMRYFGQGLVGSADDWHNQEPSHPQLLGYLAKYFVDSGYDLKALARLILNSHAYQREAALQPEGYSKPLFASQSRRRLRAEQIVDSLYHAAGLPMEVGELNMDRDGGLGPETFMNMGYPRKAWQYISLSNERDRPSLAFPRIQAVIDTLKQFGWRPSRQEPLTVREQAVHPLQPGILANGIMSAWITRLSNQHGMTDVAVDARSPGELVDTVFLRFLTRKPTPSERDNFVAFLSEGFESRIIPEKDRQPVPWPKKVPAVSWSNHLSPEANSIMIELEQRARDGDPPTNALKPEWRERMEDVLWAVINSPELMFVP